MQKDSWKVYGKYKKAGGNSLKLVNPYSRPGRLNR